MATAYFVTATLVCIWAYHQTRTTAHNIRVNRKSISDPLDEMPKDTA